MLAAQAIFIVFLSYFGSVNEEKYSSSPYPCHGIPCVTAIRIGTA